MSCLEYDPEASRGPMYNITIQECGVYAGNLSTLVTNEQHPQEITTQDVLDLREKLKEFYKGLTLPCIAWLEEAEDLNIDEFFMDLKLDESDKTIRKEDIFNSVNRLQPTRILLEGQPGSGKTSLVTRIAYDWANEKEYLNQFELLFLLPLRELQDQSVNDALETIGNVCGFKHPNKIDGIIARDEQHVIFIFDGLDELSVEDRAPILQLLYKQKYSEVTMLVTCRTGLFTLTKDEHKQLFKGISRQSTFYNKKISVLGIKNADKKMEFLEKFIIADKSVKKNKVAGLKSKVTATELFDCPLFLILLAFIINTEEKVVAFSRNTDLYKKLFNCIIKHSCAKNQIPLDECFDLFDCSSVPNYLREYLREFGNLSLQHILENNLQFKSYDLTEKIYELGFLCHHKEVIRFKSHQYYEAFHLSILEFSAAYYVWMEYKLNKSKLKEKILKPIAQLYIGSRGTSLVLGFMIGLFEEHSCDIFDGMQSFSVWFSSNFHFFAQLFKECSPHVDEKVFPFLTHFIPSNLDLMNFNNEVLRLKLFTKLIEYGTKSGRIKTIYVEYIRQTKFVKQFTFQCLRAMSVMNEDLSDVLSLMSGQVNELYLDVSSALGFGEHNIADTKKLFSTIASLKSTKCAIKLHCKARFIDSNMRDLFEETEFEKPFFHYLAITVKTNFEKLFAITLIQKNQVTHLHVSLSSDDLDISDLINAVAKSSNLRLFTFDCGKNRRTIIDLYDLTNGGTKKYEYLELKACIVKCKQPLMNRNCIHTLSVYKMSKKSLLELGEIELTHLQCSISDVYKLLEMSTPWPGANFIESIIIEESYNFAGNKDKLFFNFLCTFKNLKSLQILSNMFIDNLILMEGLKQLGIEKLVYVLEDSKEPNLFSSLINSWPKATENTSDALLGNNFKLQTIDLLYECFTEEFVASEMLALLKGLQYHYWNRVNIAGLDSDLFFNFLSDDNGIIDMSIFDVVHYVYGSDKDDYHYFKLIYKQDEFYMENAYAITLK